MRKVTGADDHPRKIPGRFEKSDVYIYLDLFEGGAAGALTRFLRLSAHAHCDGAGDTSRRSTPMPNPERFEKSVVYLYFYLRVCSVRVLNLYKYTGNSHVAVCTTMWCLRMGEG